MNIRVTVFFFICAFIACVQADSLEAFHSNETRVAYLVCNEKDDPTFSVTLDYNIADFLKTSQTIYFKKTVVNRWSAHGSVQGSIGCGTGTSLHASIKSSAKDDGIHISTNFRRIGKEPNQYSSTFVIPWTSLNFKVSDDRATIHATVRWNNG